MAITYETRTDWRTRGPGVLAGYMVMAGLTVRDLAALVGTSKTKIGALRSGADRTVSPELARKIARRLGVDPRHIFEPVSSIVHREVPPARRSA